MYLSVNAYIALFERMVWHGYGVMDGMNGWTDGRMDISGVRNGKKMKCPGMVLSRGGQDSG